MEGEEIDCDSVTFITQETVKIPPKQDCTIIKEIFDSAAKFRAKHILDKALQMLQNRSSSASVLVEDTVFDLNDTGDFKDPPKFRRKLRLKPKSSSSSSNTISNNVIVIDEESMSESLPDPHENKYTVDSKDNIVNEEFTNLKQATTAASSKEKLNHDPLNKGLEEISVDNSSEPPTNNDRSSRQTCLVCGVDIDALSYKTHSLNCLRHHFSKPDKVQTIERKPQVNCDLCKKNLTHLNSQRRAQHINDCIDKDEAARLEEVTHHQMLLAARTAVLDCPMCGRKFKVQSSRQSHLKKCAATNKMTVDQVKNLVKQQEEEHQTKLNAGILPEDFMQAKSKPLQRNVSKNSRSKGQLDEDTQLALALSTSMVENQKKDFALDRADKEGQIVAGRRQGKNKKGKLPAPASLLMTVSREEAMDRISSRVTRYIFSSSGNCSDPDTPPFKTRKLRKPTSSSSSTSLTSSSSATLWSKSSLGASALRSSQREKDKSLSFYVKELMPPVTVNTVSAGSKLRRVSTIPGWKMSAEAQQHVGTEMNANTSTASPASSQTVDILTRLAIESGCDTGGVVLRRLSSEETEFKQESADEAGDLQQSGFFNESPVKIGSDPTDVVLSYLSLVDSPRFSDLVIIAGGNAEIYAHKLVLFARCPELLAISSSKDGRDVIDLTPYGRESILSVLNYVYGGQTSLYISCLSDVRQLADRFSLAGLKSATESLDMDNLATSRTECDDEGDTDGDSNRPENRNEREVFDDSDWLDVFQTQREKLKERTEFAENSFTENLEMMEQNERMNRNCNKENEHFNDENEVHRNEINENIDLNESNVGTAHDNETNIKIENNGQEFPVICRWVKETDLNDDGVIILKNHHSQEENNEDELNSSEKVQAFAKEIMNQHGDLNVRNGSQEGNNEDGSHSIEERIQTFPPGLINQPAQKHNLGAGFTNIMDRNCSTELVVGVVGKGMSGSTSSTAGCVGTVGKNILEGSLLQDHTCQAEVTRESMELDTSGNYALNYRCPRVDVSKELNTSGNYVLNYRCPRVDVSKEQNTSGNYALNYRCPRVDLSMDLNTSESSLLNERSSHVDVSKELNTSERSLLNEHSSHLDVSRELMELNTSESSLLNDRSSHLDVSRELIELNTSESSLLNDRSSRVDVSMELNTSESSLLNERSSHLDVSRELMELNTSESSLLNERSSHVDVSRELMELNTSESSLLIDTSHVDVTKEPTPQNNDAAVISQKCKRKTKKVSKKEFTTLVHKALSSLSDANKNSLPQNQSVLTDEDIQRIQIKIEQGLQVINDPDDSVYIPNILEDTGKDQDEVIITHADIRIPVKAKRSRGKKLNVQAPKMGSFLREQQIPADQVPQAARASHAHLTTPMTSTLAGNMLLPISLTTAISSSTTLPKSACTESPIKIENDENISQSNLLTQKTVNNSCPATSISLLRTDMSSKTLFSHSVPLTALNAEACGTTPKKLSISNLKPTKSPPSLIQCSKKLTLNKLPQEYLNDVAIDDSLNASQSSEAWMNNSSTLESALCNLSNKSLTADTSSMDSPNRGQLNVSVSADICKNVRPVQGPISLPNKSADDAAYNSGEDLFSDEEDESTQSNSRITPLKWLNLSFDADNKCIPTVHNSMPQKWPSSLADKDEHSPSNFKPPSTKSLDPSTEADITSQSSNSQTRPSTCLSTSDPTWMLATHLMSYSPALREIVSKTIAGNEKSVRRNIFSPNGSETHSAANSAQTGSTSASSIRTASTSASSIRTGSNSANSIPTVNSSASSIRTASTSASSIRTASTSASSIRTVNTSASSIHTVSSSASTIPTVSTSSNPPKQIHQRDAVKTHNSTTPGSSYHAHSTSSFPDMSFSNANKDSVKMSKLREEFADNPSGLNAPKPHYTLPALFKTSIGINVNNSFTMASTQANVLKPVSPVFKPPMSPVLKPVSSALKSQMSPVLKPVSSALKSQMSPVLKPQVVSVLKPQMTTVLKPQMTLEFKVQMSSPSKPQLKVHSTSIRSPNKKIPELAASLPDCVTNIRVQDNLPAPHYNSFTDPLTSSVSRTLSTFNNNNIPASQTERNSFSEISLKDTNMCQIFTSLHSKIPPKKSGVVTDDLPFNKLISEELATLASEKGVNFASNARQFHEVKTSLTGESWHAAKYMEADDIPPLRQRLGLSNPCQGNNRQQPIGLKNTERSELSSVPGPSSNTKAETNVQQAAHTNLNQHNTDIIILDDSLSLEDFEVIDKLVEDLPKQVCKTPQNQNFRGIKNKKRDWKEPSPFTPMAPYDQMATPELKKAVSKIGVRPLGKKRMRDLLKHVYQETHQYETDSDYDGTPVKLMRHNNSQPPELSARARLSHQPISSSGLAPVQNKLKPAAKKTKPSQINPAANLKTVNKAEKKNTIADGRDLQHKYVSPLRAVVTRSERIPESGSDCASMPEDICDSHEEISGSQDSSYSDGADLPEESILHGWPEEDLAPSQLIQTSSQAAKDKLVQFVSDNKDVYESILMYEPLELDVLKKRLSDAGVKVSLSQVMDFLDERCITFTMKNMSTRNNNRQRKAAPKHSGKAPSKTKAFSQRAIAGSQQKSHK